MNPKKSKSFIDEFSKELKLDPQLVDDLVDFYYKECRDILSNLKHTRLNIDGLGHFVSRPNLVKKSIDKIIKSLNNHDTSTFSAYYNKKKLEEKLVLLKNLLKKQDLEKERKNKFKNKKNELKKDLGEQKTNL